MWSCLAPPAAGAFQAGVDGMSVRWQLHSRSALGQEQRACGPPLEIPRQQAGSAGLPDHEIHCRGAGAWCRWKR
jgi:hypothetical protein